MNRFWLRELTKEILNRGKIKSDELKREVERGSTFTHASDLSCIASILFSNANFTHATRLKLRDTRN